MAIAKVRGTRHPESSPCLIRKGLSGNSYDAPGAVPNDIRREHDRGTYVRTGSNPDMNFKPLRLLIPEDAIT